jgi:glycosyltransferase involved in cell wall biosynthesis
VKPRLLLVIPVHKEAAYLPDCLSATRRAARRTDVKIEIIVQLWKKNIEHPTLNIEGRS